MLGRILALMLVAACYTPPQPACGFVCDPATPEPCPGGYHCTSDRRCHLDGTADFPPCAYDAGFMDSRQADADLRGPYVIQRSPTIGATGVSVTASVTAVFNEQVYGVDTTTFTLSDGSPVTANVSYTPNVATLTPSSDLSGNTVYFVGLSSTIRDEASYPLDELAVWSFTTMFDGVAPVVIGTDPADGTVSNGVTASILVQFNEPVLNIGPGSFVVQVNAASVNGTITPYGPRSFLFQPVAAYGAAGTTVNVTLTNAITDNSGNSLVQTTFSFGT